MDHIPMQEVYKTAKRLLPQISVYFPDYEEVQEEFRPQRDYFWNVYHTLDPQSVSKIVDRLVKAMNDKKNESQNNMIVIREDIYQLLCSSELQSSKSH